MNVVSRDEAETRLGITSGTGGAFLDSLLDMVSRRIAAAIGREAWESAERTEYHDGDAPYLFLRNWPVTAVAIYDDPEHVWGADTVVSADDYYTDARGIVSYKSGRFQDGDASIKVVYTAGYASESDVPGIVREGALMLLEREWNARKRAGRNLLESFQQTNTTALPVEIMSVLAPAVRRIPFA